METYYWETKEPHSDNSETMLDWIKNHNTSLIITWHENSCAEGIDDSGNVWTIHASGNGDFCSHKVEFTLRVKND